MQIRRARADAGDRDAILQLAVLLGKAGDRDGLRARADAGDHAAALRLAELLEERGDPDGAAQALRARADVGHTTSGASYLPADQLKAWASGSHW
jgi:hypothetical protein